MKNNKNSKDIVDVLALSAVVLFCFKIVVSIVLIVNQNFVLGMLDLTFESEELEEFVIPVVPIITIVIDTIIVSTSFLLIKNAKNDNSLYKEIISIINIFIVSDLCTIITSKITSGIVKSYTTSEGYKTLMLGNAISYTELLFKYSKFLLAIAAAISIGKKIMIKHDNN